MCTEKTVRILVVEDDPGMLASCQQALEMAGYRVLPASSPGSARQMLAEEEPALVITDLRMPGGGGQEVIRFAREKHPGLPIIVITAYSSVESAVDIFKTGVMEYLLKPFTVDQLLEAVERHVRAGEGPGGGA